MESIRCTSVGCTCACFAPMKTQLRKCSTCLHGWVIHAMDKIGQNPSGHVISFSAAAAAAAGGGSVKRNDPAQINIVFDLASLILFGSDAIPVHFKILLDRLFAHIDREVVQQILAAFSWSHDEYTIGYKIRDPAQFVLNKWSMTTKDEELVILDQFLRFTETKSIAEDWLRATANDLASAQRTGRIQAGPHPQSPLEVKQILGPTDPNVSRHLFGAGYLSSFLPRYPGIYSPFLAGPGSAVGPLSQASVLPYLLCRSPIRSLSKPMDYRMDSSEPAKKTTDDAGSGRRVGEVADESRGQCGVVKVEAGEERSTKSMFQAVDEDEEPIDYSTKDDRVVPDVATTYSSMTISRNSSVTGSPVENPATVTFPIQDSRPQQRKSLNQAKKTNQPTPGYGGTLLSPTGKKRVLCTACLKTFCDKGALKIHYSAVHLKELHRCTIDGCTMTFSSRRSRNRHSANPNPKLHFGQTGRRRLHNNSNNNSDDNSLIPAHPDDKDCQEDEDDEEDEAEMATVCSSSSPSPRLEPLSPDGEFQLCPRSSDDSVRGDDDHPSSSSSSSTSASSSSSCSPSVDTPQPLAPDSDAASRFFLGLGLNRPPAKRKEEPEIEIAADGGAGTDGKTQSPEVEGGHFRSQCESGSQQRNASKRKSALPVRCCSSGGDFEGFLDLHSTTQNSSDPKRPRFSTDQTEIAPEVEESDVNGTRTGYGNVCLPTPMEKDEDDKSSLFQNLPLGIRHCSIPLGQEEKVKARVTQSPAVGSSVFDLSGTAVDLSMYSKKRNLVEGQEVELESKDGETEECQLSPDDEGSAGLRKVQRSVHVCKVQGCSAEFLSRRSRDRHSANANLHQALLSPDSTDTAVGGWAGEGGEKNGEGEKMSEGNQQKLSTDWKRSIEGALNLSAIDGKNRKQIGLEASAEEKMEEEAEEEEEMKGRGGGDDDDKGRVLTLASGSGSSSHNPDAGTGNGIHSTRRNLNDSRLSRNRVVAMDTTPSVTTTMAAAAQLVA